MRKICRIFNHWWYVIETVTPLDGARYSFYGVSIEVAEIKKGVTQIAFPEEGDRILQCRICRQLSLQQSEVM